MPRRIADPYNYEFLSSLQPINQFMTLSAYVLALSQLVLFINFFYSLYRGKKAVENPWEANTLEWATASPPPEHNFDTAPVVYRGPYEYSSPEVADDWLPQNRALEGAVAEKGPGDMAAARAAAD
jgi:cytochrome c oxidase subunit 1